MAKPLPYGYWTFNNNKNGLAGVVGDADNPAVLDEDFIVHALHTSRIAACQFERLFPTLLPEEQARLLDILARRPKARYLISNPQDYNDRYLRQSIRQSVRGL
jgi:hypothetical protein